jgi:hypothetical protein
MSSICREPQANDQFPWRAEKLEVNGFHGKGPAEIGTFPGLEKLLTHQLPKLIEERSMCEIEERYKVTYVQRVHYLAEINDEFHIVFNYIAKLGAYGCLFDEHTINTPIKEDNNRHPT